VISCLEFIRHCTLFFAVYTLDALSHDFVTYKFSSLTCSLHRVIAILISLGCVE
jgi:hypothetical protein